MTVTRVANGFSLPMSTVSRVPKRRGVWSALTLMLTAVVGVLQVTAGEIPRTADGKPDLQGVWTNATITRLERPPALGERLVLTDAEAAQMEGTEATRVATAALPSDLDKELPPARDGVGGYNNFWIDRGSKVVELDGQKRSSLIVDPANGRIPYRGDARKAMMALFRDFNRFDGPEQRPLGERCLLAFGSSSGPPMLPVLYNNHYQIVQTPDHVMILVEMVHDARIIRVDGQRHSSPVRKWLGDSIAHWDRDTLVIETVGFHPQQRFRGSSDQLKVTERISPIDRNTLRYRATLEDPTLFAQPWTVELPLNRSVEPMYEYACHEGNYALPGILAGARVKEANGEAPSSGPPINFDAGEE